MDAIKRLLKELRKGKEVNFKSLSYIALGVSVFFLIGAFFGETSQDTLPTILCIAVIAAGLFGVLKLFDKLQVEQLAQEKQERLEKDKRWLLEQEERKHLLEKEKQERLEREKQERLEKERALQEQIAQQKERQRKEREKVIDDFWAAINLEEELNNIFSVLEKTGATASNFEKGIEHLFAKTKANLAKEEVLPTIRKAMFARALDDENCAVATAVAVDFFLHDVVQGDMLTRYVRFSIAKEKYPTPEMMEPLVKALYGVAGHAYNYLRNRLAHGSQQVLTSETFIPVIENSTVPKSYTDVDPFTVDEVRQKWAKDLCNAPFELVHSSKLKALLDKEEYVDALCFYTYALLLRERGERIEDESVDKIASIYMEYLEGVYSRIKR